MSWAAIYDLKRTTRALQRIHHRRSLLCDSRTLRQAASPLRAHNGITWRISPRSDVDHQRRRRRPGGVLCSRGCYPARSRSVHSKHLRLAQPTGLAQGLVLFELCVVCRRDAEPPRSRRVFGAVCASRKRLAIPISHPSTHREREQVPNVDCCPRRGHNGRARHGKPAPRDRVCRLHYG